MDGVDGWRNFLPVTRSLLDRRATAGVVPLRRATARVGIDPQAAEKPWVFGVAFVRAAVVGDSGIVAEHHVPGL